MLSFINKYSVFTINRVWFMDRISDINSNADVIRYLRIKNSPDSYGKATLESVSTLWTDLRCDEKQILSNFNKQVRYEIKRSASDNIIWKIWNSEQLKKQEDILLDFKKVYDHFCELSNQESLKKDFDLKKINSYIDNNCIYISCAEFEKGKVYHIYVADSRDALLIYSASDFRNEGVDRNVAGRANKMSHYKDMLYFKGKGLINYDWGNVKSFEEPNGIDKFKMAFGGKHVEVYNLFVGNTWKGKLIVSLYWKIRKRRERKAR